MLITCYQTAAPGFEIEKEKKKLSFFVIIIRRRGDETKRERERDFSTVSLHLGPCYLYWRVSLQLLTNLIYDLTDHSKHIGAPRYLIGYLSRPPFTFYFLAIKQL